MDDHISRPDLEEALEQLEQFSQLVEQPSFNPNEPLDNKPSIVPSSLRRIIQLAYRVVGVFSSSNQRPTDLIDQVLICGDIVKSYFPLIHLLEEGDAIQQKYARDVKEVVNRFNCAVDSCVNQFPRWGNRIARFLCGQGVMMVGGRLAKIELPSRAYKQIHFPQFQGNNFALDQSLLQRNFQERGADSTQKISALCRAAMPLAKPPSQTMELYLMKVISLLEKSRLMLNSEAREIVRLSDYHVALDNENHVMTISQVLTPMPGQTIEVSGAFKRDPRTLLYNIFLPESCHLSTNSKQTGFPHPLQRHGWALSEALIPICLPESYISLQAPKKMIAIDLLPGGSLYPRATLLLKMKKQAFENDRSLFLQLHSKLALALCHASGSYSQFNAEVIERFFSFLQQQPNVYALMSNIHYEIMESSIVIPQKALLKALAISKINFGTEDASPERVFIVSFQNAIKDNAKSYTEQQVRDYISLMGTVLVEPSRQITIQSYADIGNFKTVDLNPFALKIQSSLLLQLQDFHHELVVAPNLIDMAVRMRTLLEDEILSLLK